MQLVEIARFTDNVQQMTDFYAHLLDSEPQSRSDEMAVFLVNGVKIFIHKTYTPGVGDLPPENHIAFRVSDLDATCHDLAVQGFQLEAAPRDYYWGRSAYLRDPDGQLVEITQ